MNISISEIIVVILVALIVIKPEQLPGAAFKLGQWTKRFKTTVAKLRNEIDGTVNNAVSQNTSANLEKPAENLLDK